MKRYIRYMVVILIAIMFAQINCFAQSEDDNQKTTEISKEDDMRLFTSENKVWEMSTDIYDELAGLTYYAFRGTEEKNGKTYSRLCCIAYAEGSYYIPKQEWLMGSGIKQKIIISDWEVFETSRVVDLIREENGKVFLYDEKTDLSERYPKSEYPLLYDYEGDEHEMLIMDFNCKEGDNWNVVYNYGYGEIRNVKVNKIETEIIDGVECKRFEAETMTTMPSLDVEFQQEEDPFKLNLELIEGLGIVDNWNNENFYTVPTAAISTGGVDRQLCHVYDRQGNAILGTIEVTTSGVDKIYSDNEIKLYRTNGVVWAESEGNEKISLSIYSAEGGVVATTMGIGNVEYPLTGLQKGVYIVRAVAGNSAGKTIRVAI